MKNLNIHNYKQKLFSEWMEKTRKNIINEDILLLNFKDETNLEKALKLNFFQKLNPLHELKITSLKKLDRSDLNNKKKINIIIIENKDISLIPLIKLRNTNIKMQYHTFTTYSQIENYSIKTLEKSGIIKEENKHCYIETREYRNFLSSIPYTEYFISTFLDNSANNKLRFKKQDVKRYLLRSSKINLNIILDDIEYLKQTNILTARLAIFIYKISTFNYHETDKEIGTIHTKLLGKSKVYNNKQFNIKNTKGYIINNQYNLQEDIIRKEIAEKLIKNFPDMSIVKLSDACGIPLKLFLDYKNDT